jgi:hypothetical protein
MDGTLIIGGTDSNLYALQSPSQPSSQPCPRLSFVQAFDANQANVTCVTTGSCSPGTGLVANLCSPCAPGTFQDGTSRFCAPCPANTASFEYGQMSCVSTCPAGTGSLGGNMTCAVCVAGFFNDGTSLACRPCPIGGVSPIGSSTCSLECPFMTIRQGSACVSSQLAYSAPWPSPGRNQHHGGRSIFSATKTKPTVAWTFPSQGAIMSSPAVGSMGIIYFGSGYEERIT